MGAEIDRLEVEVEASAAKANAELNKLIAKLDKVASSLSGINTENLSGIGETAHRQAGETEKGAKETKKLSNSFAQLSGNLNKSRKKMTSFAQAAGKFYSNCFMLIRGVKKLGSAIESSMDYVETYNYFSVTMDKIGKEFGGMYEQYGYDSAEAYADSFTARLNNLTKKMTGYEVGESGELTMTDSIGLALDPEAVMNYQSSIAAITNSVGLIGENSVNASKALTMLSADMSSLKNIDLQTAMTNFQSGLIGQSRALYKYGIDITNATLQTYAYDLGLSKSVSEMTQAEKMQLRLIAILDQSKVAWGDQARTINSVANQYRILKQQISNLARIIGNLFLPIVSKVLPVVNGLVIALQKLFTVLGFKLWCGNWLKDAMDGISGGSDLGDLEDSADDTADSLSNANKAAEKLKTTVRGIDELNIISPDTDTSSGNSGTSGIGEIDLSDAIGAALEEYESVWEKAFAESENKAQEYADKICSIFTRMWNAIEPFRKAIVNLWDNGLGKLADFAWTGLKDFYNEFLVPVGKWAFGTEDSGLTRLVNIINDGLMAIDWEGLSTSLKDFWIAVEPYAESFGEGLLDFIEDLKNIGVDIINRFPGFFGDLAEALNKNDPESARDWGYALGVLGTGIAGLSVVNSVLGGLGKFFGLIKDSALAKTVTSLGGALKGLFSGISFSKITSDISGFFALIKEYGFSQTISGLFGDFSGIGSMLSASLNPGMIGQLGITIEQMLGGTVFDTNTWTGKAKEINDAINNTIDSIGSSLSNGASKLGRTVREFFNSIFNWDSTLSLFEDAKKNFEKGGLYIIQGVLEGICGAVGFIVEPIGDFFKNLWDAFCDVFGIHSSAESMKPIGQNILLGIVEGFREKFDSFMETINQWWEEYVSPWFTAEKWQELFTGIWDGLSAMWGALVNWWNESAIGTWWNKDVAPWFTKEKWISMYQNIKNALKKVWDNTVGQWITDINLWWNKNVEPWFTREKWEELLSKVPEAFRSSFKNAANAAIEIFNKLIDWINSKMHFSWDAITILGKQIVPAGSVQLFTIPQIPKFETGGFPETGQLFIARENGINEMVGQIGHRSAVANNDQIVEAIRSAVVQGMNTEEQNALLREQNDLLRAILDKDLDVTLDGRSIVNEIDKTRKRMGTSFQPVYG